MIDSEDLNTRTDLSDERSESADALGLERIVGQSPGIRDVKAAIDRIAPQNQAVLIVGETGTGRSLVAQTIHDRSPRSQQPFVTVNGAASELEDELYGRAPDPQMQPGGTVGKCEAVSGGTLFVDDIGAVGTAIQAGVQRLIQEQRFDRRDKGDSAGGNVRIIASAERDLTPAVQGGYFRRDLLGQFQGATIHLVPLRDRPEDIPALAAHFVALFNRELGKDVQNISPEAMQMLQSYRWPGNVREFQETIRQAMLQATNQELTTEHLPGAVRDSVGSASTSSTRTANLSTPQTSSAKPVFQFDKLLEFVRSLLAEGRPDVYRNVIQEIDRHVLHETMKHFRNNQLQAAERLGISRMTLRAKLRSLGMLPNRSKD